MTNSHINTRYALLRALGGTETIVPNESRMTHTVVNHSLSRPNVRVAWSHPGVLWPGSETGQDLDVGSHA